MFTEWQLRQFVNNGLFPEHVKTFLWRMLDYNNLRLTEYLSSLFNLGHISHYCAITATDITGYEYENVVREFELIGDKLRRTEIFTIYGIDPLDAIYRHAGYSNGYDGFAGQFFDDLFALMEIVDAEGCMDYMADITTLLRYLVECVERHFIAQYDDVTAVYVVVSSTPEHLTILVR